MAEKEQSKFSIPAYTGSEGKQVKKRKTVFEKAMNKKSLDKSRNNTSQYRRGFPAVATTEGSQGA